MSKKIFSGLVCLFLICSLFTFALTIQSTNAQIIGDEGRETLEFEFEGGATLVLLGVTGNLRAYGTPTENYPPLPEEPPRDEIPSIQSQLSVDLSDQNGAINKNTAWNIVVCGRGSFTSGIVGLPYFGSNPEEVEMWQIDLIRGDVNADGVVNYRDLYIIKRALWSSRWDRWGRRRWNPACDLNWDGKITWRDLYIAWRNFGKSAEWEQLDNVWSDGVMIYGETDHFSIFRGR